MSANRGVMPDDELVDLIVDAYRSESFTVFVDQITNGRRVAPAPRRPRRSLRTGLIAAAALAVAAVVLVGAAVMTGFVGLGGGGGVEPATSDSPAADPGAKPPAPTTSATDDGQRCADVAAQQETPFSLPPQRFALTGPEPLRVRLYGNGDVLAVCWLNHDRVDISGPSVIVDPTSSNYTMEAYGIGIVDPAYFPGPAEIAFGEAAPGTLAVEIRFASGEPIHAQLVDGWWAYLVVGDHRLADSTELVMITPDGEIVEPIRHG